jgi:hypothetical protein
MGICEAKKTLTPLISEPELLYGNEYWLLMQMSLF